MLYDGDAPTDRIAAWRRPFKVTAGRRARMEDMLCGLYLVFWGREGGSAVMEGNCCCREGVR